LKSVAYAGNLLRLFQIPIKVFMGPYRLKVHQFKHFAEGIYQQVKQSLASEFINI